MKRAFSLAGCLMAFLVVFMTGCADKNGGATPPTPITPVLVAPTVTLTAPARAETGVPVNSSLTATFSQAMDRLTITAASFSVKKNIGAVLIPGALTFDATNKSVIFKPTNPSGFEANTTYTATFTTAVKDQAGTAMEAEYNWNFITAVTADITKPTVIATSAYGTTGVTSGATGLPINRVSTVTFSEAMDPSTITATTFTVTSPGGTVVPGAVSHIGTTATFDPASNLVPDTLYTSTITTGAKDLAGNGLVANYVWSWTTGTSIDNTAPKVAITNPVNLATNVLLNQTVNATFDKDMKSATMIITNFTVKETVSSANVPGTVAYNTLTKIATFSPQNPLSPGTKYTATVTNGATDLASNSLVAGAVANPWTFTTAATVIPSPGLVNLGRAATFGMAATAGVTNIPSTHINGDTVLTTTPTCNGVNVLFADGPGFGLCGGSPPTINGTVITPLYPDTTTATGVLADLRAAYIFLAPANMPGATNLPAGTTLGAITGSAEVIGDNLFYPGVYQSLTTILITGDLILDARGDANATFVFQSSGAIDAAAGGAPPATRTRIILRNGAKASNVFWWNGSGAVTLGLYSEWQGNILSYSDVTLKTGATSCGRLFAGASTDGLFVFDNNIVSVPGQPFAPPAGYSTVCQ